MKYEKTQKGNPHQLTVNQHCFPARSIERFVQTNGLVDVLRIENSKNFRVKPGNPLFCARRAWDQRAESSFMKPIEDVYQELAERVINDKVLQLSKADQTAITDMYALWNIRWSWSQKPIKNQRIDGAVRLECELSMDDQESLEKAGISAIGPDFAISGRSITGVKIQLNFFELRKNLQDAHWGILKSKKGEFVVPDNSCSSYMLPVAPQICLFSPSENREISKTELAAINAQSIQDSTEYYFARDLSKCP